MDGVNRTWLLIIGSGAGLLCAALVVFPLWNVWAQGLRGEAALVRAESEKQVKVESARAEKEAAVLRAEAIAIIGEAAKQYPEYRMQEFIGGFAEALQEGKIRQIIYVPTEANIPILEARRLEQEQEKR